MVLVKKQSGNLYTRGTGNKKNLKRRGESHDFPKLFKLIIYNRPVVYIH